MKVGRLVERRMQAALHKHGLTAAHYLALSHLAELPRSSRSELGRGLLISPQAAGGIAERLMAAGYVSRRTADDGIQIELSLTDRGHELLACARPEVDKVNQEIVRLFKPEHASFIEGATEHILAHLGGHPLAR
jgi:DNA-binding MarR family transcriptional regulator